MVWLGKVSKYLPKTTPKNTQKPRQVPLDAAEENAAKISAAAWIISGGLGLLVLLTSDWDYANKLHRKSTETHALSDLKPAVRKVLSLLYPTRTGESPSELDGSTSSSE